MSLYGNIKKVDSSLFIFDRIYKNRKEMDDNASNDGVYIGRYVLVEYGERFNGVQAGTNIEYNEQTNNYIVTESGITVNENEEFLNNRTIDLEMYGAVYDSTVWQKIYINNVQKYIMIAELNATVPKIDMKLKEPIKYQKTDNNEDEEELYVSNGKDIYQLIGAKQEYTKPSFDTTLDTELAYLMHQPKSLNFKVDNKYIDYNKNGFNQAYSYGPQKGENAIAWVPEPGSLNWDFISNTNLAQLIEDNQEINTKILMMKLPLIGNTLNDLYDLLYGQPKGDLSNGILRPYFQDFVKLFSHYTYPVKVRDENGNLVNLIINGEKQYVLIQDLPINPYMINIDDTILFDEFGIASNLDIQPNTVQVLRSGIVEYKQNINIDDQNIHILQGTDVTVNFTGDSDSIEWLKEIPTIGEILENNSSGLAGILTKLFGKADPLTGKVKFYLYNDWLAPEKEILSGPCIINKPKVITGTPITFTPKEEYLPNLLIDENNPSENLLYTYIDTQNDINTYIDGNSFVDYNSWQLTSTMSKQILLTIDKYNEEINNLENYSQFNQDEISITQIEDKIYLYGNKAYLNNNNNDTFYIDIYTNVKDTQILYINEEQQIIENNHIKYKLNINELSNKVPVTLTFSSNNYFDKILEFYFIDYIPNLSVLIKPINNEININKNNIKLRQLLNTVQLSTSHSVQNFEYNNEEAQWYGINIQIKPIINKTITIKLNNNNLNQEIDENGAFDYWFKFNELYQNPLEFKFECAGFNSKTILIEDINEY